jgi:hypothetical protein
MDRKGQGISICLGFFLGFPVRQRTGKLRDFGYPSSIGLTLSLNIESQSLFPRFGEGIAAGSRIVLSTAFN